MKDEAIATSPQLTPAETAINYLLQRIRLDPDLRHYMIHTEAFRRLCEAEAHRTGEDPDAVEKRYSEAIRERPPLVVTARMLLCEIKDIIEDAATPHDQAVTLIAKAIEAARFY